MTGSTSSQTPRTPLPLRVLLGALAVLVVWLAVGGIGGASMGKLSQVQKNDQLSFLPASSESTAVAKEVARLTEGAGLPLLIVMASEDPITPRMGEVQRFAQGLLDVDVKGTPLRHYLQTEQIVSFPSKDGKAAMVVVPLSRDKVDAKDTSGHTALNPTVAAVRDAAHTADLPGVEVQVGGPAGFVTDLTKAFAGIDGTLLIVALVAVLLILLVVYRSPVLPIVVLATAIFGLAAAGGVVHLVARNGWLDLSGQSQGILSILVVGAATDYALLLVSRYKEELHREPDPWVALKRAWRASLPPVAASAATVVLGLLMLMFADLTSTASLGPIGALGIAGAFVAALTFLPAMLVLGRRWIFWPVIPHVDGEAPQRATGWAKVAALVGKRPRTVLAVTSMALLAAAAFVPTLRIGGTPQSEIFLRDVESVAAQQLLARHFDAGSGSPLQLTAPQDKADAVVAKLAATEGIVNPYVGAARGAQPTVVDGRVLIQATLTHEADDPASQTVVRDLRTQLDEIGADVLVGGSAAQTLDTRVSADRDLWVVAPIITLAVFLVLCVLLKSLVAPLMLILANVLSFGATMGISALVFNGLHLPHGDPTTLLYGFVFLVALGVDYSIFLMSRAREEAETGDTRRGVLTSLTVTGGVITSAGIVLAATFGALAVVPLLFLAQLAFIVAFGVLMDTFVVRSLLIPAVVVGSIRRACPSWPARSCRPGRREPRRRRRRRNQPRPSRRRTRAGSRRDPCRWPCSRAGST